MYIRPCVPCLCIPVTKFNFYSSVSGKPISRSHSYKFPFPGSGEAKKQINNHYNIVKKSPTQMFQSLNQLFTQV